MEIAGGNGILRRMTNLIDDMNSAILRAQFSASQSGEDMSGDAMFVIAALYKFVALPDYQDLQHAVQKLCDENAVQGTVLLAEEGINGTICAPKPGMKNVLNWIQAEPRMAGLSLKFSIAPEQAFLRMKVRLKREIVTMGRPEIRPAEATGTYVTPKDWDALIDDPDVMVIDTRNRYETAIGSFRGAVDPATDNFREFPEWAEKLAAMAPDQRPKKLAMFCTGGIRCEKASALMQTIGFDEVYHLQGGILKYLEEIPAKSSSWQGECFVFDGRVAVDHDLAPGQYGMCHACRMPLSPEEQLHPHFEAGISCPHCHTSQKPERRQRFVERQKQMALAQSRGEAHLGTAARDHLAKKTNSRAANKTNDKASD